VSSLSFNHCHKPDDTEYFRANITAPTAAEIMQLKAELRIEAASKPPRVVKRRQLDDPDGHEATAGSSKKKRGAVTDASQQHNEQELRGFLFGSVH
jgi:hypothetical protein